MILFLVTPGRCPLPGPGLSVACLQSLWIQAGCTRAGLQYPSPGNIAVLQSLSTLLVRYCIFGFKLTLSFRLLMSIHI